MTKFVAISLWGRCLTSYPADTDWEFPNFLAELGLNVVPLGDTRATHYVAMDHSERALERVTRQIPLSRRLLFVFEPQAVNPRQYKLKTRSKYGSSIIGSERHRRMPSDRLIRLGTLPKIEKYSVALSKQREREAGSIGILNENKFSFTPKNLYKFRWRTIADLSKSGLIVDLGGKNWEQGWGWHLKQQLLTLAVTVQNACAIDLFQFHGPLPRSTKIRLHGRVESELEFLSKFDFCLVIENDPDYVSEKLFNAVMAGGVPLYVGPPLAEFDIPQEVVVEMGNANASFAEVIQSLSESKKDALRNAGRKWLGDSQQYEKWSHAEALRTMAAEIQRFLSLN